MTDTNQRITISDSVQGRHLVERAFRLRSGTWTLLSIGSRNTLFRVRSGNESWVVRQSTSQTVQEIESESRFAGNLLALGIDVAPRFRRTSDGARAFRYGGFSYAVYRYITGSICQPLSDMQFYCLLDILPAYLAAIRSSGSSDPKLRRWPRPTWVLRQVRSALRILPSVRHRVPDLLRLRPRVSKEAWAGKHVIHSDLHAGNFVWKGNRLVGILDFERHCAGTVTLELAALVTGTCFRSGRLELRRVADVAAVAGEDVCIRGDIAGTIDLWILVALYFFQREFWERMAASTVRTVPLNVRDLIRAQNLAQRRDEVRRALEKALH